MSLYKERLNILDFFNLEEAWGISLLPSATYQEGIEKIDIGSLRRYNKRQWICVTTQTMWIRYTMRIVIMGIGAREIRVSHLGDIHDSTGQSSGQTPLTGSVFSQRMNKVTSRRPFQPTLFHSSMRSMGKVFN